MKSMDKDDIILSIFFLIGLVALITGGIPTKIVGAILLVILTIIFFRRRNFNR